MKIKNIVVIGLLGLASLFLSLNWPNILHSADQVFGNAVQLQDENGDAYGVKQVGNKPRVSVTQYTTDVVKDLLTGHVARSVIGYNSDINGVLEDLTEIGAIEIPVPTTFERMQIVSTSVLDNYTSSGSQTVDVFGLNSSMNELLETVSMNGLTNVTTVNYFSRINVLHTKTIETRGVAAGDITIKSLDDVNTYNQITAGGNMSLQAHYTIPAGFRALIYEWTPAIVSNKSTVARAFLRATVDWDDRSLLPGVFIFQDVVVSDSGGNPIHLDPPILVPSEADIKISAQRVLGTGTVIGTGSFRFVQEPNP